MLCPEKQIGRKKHNVGQFGTMASPAQNETGPAGGPRGLEMENQEKDNSNKTDKIAAAVQNMVRQKLQEIGSHQGAFNNDELAEKLETVSAEQILDSVGSAAAIERGACVAMAFKCNQIMAFDWFNCQYREISDNNKIWEPLRKKTVEALKDKRHSNPGQFISRMRDAGRVLRYGQPEKTQAADGSRNRLPFDRVEQELGKLYKFLNDPSNDEAIKASPEFDRLAKANESITRTLRDDLGIDLNRYSAGE